MCSNDYPHPNSPWPHSRAIIDRDLGGSPADVLAKLVRENVCKLYNLTPPSWQPASLAFALAFRPTVGDAASDVEEASMPELDFTDSTVLSGAGR